MNFFKYSSLLIAILLGLNLKAQTILPFPELKIKLNEEGSNYIKATILNQVWVRHTWNNPGSTVDGYAQDKTFDIGLRRTRLQVMGKVQERIFFHLQIGQNNLGYNSTRKQGLFFHDAVGEIEFIKRYLSIGAGITGWAGFSRYSAPAIGNAMTLDVPLYQQATNDVNDQFLRKYALYAKGKIGKLDYRLALAKPMTIKNSTVQGSNIGENSTFSAMPPKVQWQAYIMYQFLDEEANTTPYMAGTYLGKKDIFTLGAGFLTQKDALWHSENLGQDTVLENLLLLNVDAFYEHPFDKEKQNAFTAYAAYSYTDFGKDYVRNLGVMNPTNGSNANATYNGAGNAFPMIGTGHTFYAQMGYIFRKDLLQKWGTLQPYAAMQYAQFDALKEASIMYEAGFNWFISNHGAKLSFNYQNRPVFNPTTNGELKVQERKGMFVTQLQISI